MSILRRSVHCSWRGSCVLFVAYIVLGLAPWTRAGTGTPRAEPTPPPTSSLDSRISFSLESAYLFQPIPNPFFALAGRHNENPLDYHLATQIVSIRYRVADVGGPWSLRQNLELSAGIIGSAITRGPESFYAGYLMGVRYTLVPHHLPLKPFVEVRGGVGWTDSQGFRYAQQQDLAFTYLLELGVRYDLGSRWNATAAVMDQHISNAYMTHPNYGFDSVGILLGATRRF